MQIIEIELTNLNFYCPVTGEHILLEEEPVNEDASTLMAYWVDMAFEEPFFKNEELKEKWDLFCPKFVAENDGYDPEFEDLENFLKEINWPNWVCFKLNHSGMACGPVSNTVWKVLNLNVIPVTM